MRRRGLLVVAVAGLLLAPLASSASAASVQLALVPLPKSALGAAASSLPLAQDSGVVSNAEAGSNSSGGVTAKRLKRLGRISGYSLDYGTFGQGPGLHSAQTGVERYRSPADAHKALAFWRRDELDNRGLKKLGLDFSVEKLTPSGIPGRTGSTRGRSSSRASSRSPASTPSSSTGSTSSTSPFLPARARRPRASRRRSRGSSTGDSGSRWPASSTGSRSSCRGR